MSSATPLSSRCEPAPQALSASRPKNSVFASPVWMVAVGLAVRMLCIVGGGLYKFDLLQWLDLETANVGRSLALGHGFGSPFGASTGPTAWVAPVYPWIISLVFRVLGIFSYRAAFALLAFNSVFSALTSWTIYRSARRLFGQKVGLWSGWAWALLPFAIYWPVIWIWDTALSAFLLSLAFMLTIEMEGDNRLLHWFQYGLLWGIIALTNTSMLSWLPFSGCWLAYGLWRSGKRFVVPVAVSAVVFWAVITPWLVRNYIVFDKLIFVRGDFGSELRTGNNPLAKGTFVPSLRAGSNGALTAQYQKVGEVAWDAQQSLLARTWIAENPGKFLELSCMRIFLFWSRPPERLPFHSLHALLACVMLLPIAGLYLAVRRKTHGVFLFITLVLFYPLIYYLTFTSPRYRHPIEPELLILAVWLLTTDQLPVKSNSEIAKAPNKVV